jgi:hypothetical protein
MIADRRHREGKGGGTHFVVWRVKKVPDAFCLPGHKAALLRARVADVRAFAADPALAWSAPPWRRGRGWRIAE